MRLATPPGDAGAVLLVGASRGLGFAMAADFLKRGFSVVGTVRGGGTALHGLAEAHPGRLEIQTLDITVSEEIAALRERLEGRRFEVLFVNAGVVNADPQQAAAATPKEEVVRVFVTNALSPLSVIEGLEDLVAADGLIGVMSSGQGSLSNNEKGGNDVYRASKAALNQFMRCYAARRAAEARALVLMAPGWIRTDMGGPRATFSVEEAVPKVVDVLLAQKGRPGLRFLDREGRPVPW
jgi:NAD(P)-dependent dehydrogenase (short-subunit alcohol dehydrogenase family)